MDRLWDVWLLVRDEVGLFFIAALPVTELRGAIPLGIAQGMSPLKTYIICVLGNLLPAPVLLLFLEPIFKKMRQTPLLRGLADWSIKRSLKRSQQIKKYSALGLLFFVAIPLPSTGVWTGCIAASLLGVRFRYAFPAVAAGTIIAGLLVLGISLHII